MKKLYTLVYIIPGTSGNYCFEYFSKKRTMKRRRRILLNQTSVYNLRLFVHPFSTLRDMPSYEKELIAYIEESDNP